MFKSKTALIPMELVRINDRRDLIEIEADKSHIEDSPTFSKDEEITPDYEDRVHRHFGLQIPDSSEERGLYGDYVGGEDRREDGSRRSDRDPDDVDTAYGERAESGESDERAAPEYGSREPRAAETRDESRSLRSGESGRSDATAETGERVGPSSGSPGDARVRKRLKVPARREEVHVDRVESDSGDDELRVRKEVVEGEETVDVPEDTGRRVR